MRDPRGYAHSFELALGGFVREAAARVPGFAARLHDAGLAPLEVTTLAALDRLPVLTKDELVDLQAADPPFAGMVAPDARPRRVFQSPGPLYEVEFGTPDHWRWRAALEAAGFSSDDIVINAFAYHLTPAGAMFEQACHEVGAAVLPAGVGSLDAQVRACADLGVTGYIGVPSYLKALLEHAGGSDRPLKLRRAFVTAEPLPPSLREWLLGHLEVVRQGYGTAETGNLGYECAEMDGWHAPADALVQVCDLTTGEAIYGGDEGQVVATVLSPDAPLVRFGTGDLSAWHDEPCACGLATPRLRGWLGRVGEAVKVKGMFLHPRQVAQVMGSVEGIDGYRLTVDRIDHRDILRCAVVPTGRERGDIAAAVKSRIREHLRFDVDVRLVDALSDGPAIEDLRSWT